MDIRYSKLTAVFRGDIELVLALYRSDVLFAEICDDFVSLVENQCADTPMAADVVESLKGLEDELRLLISAFKRAADTSETNIP